MKQKILFSVVCLIVCINSIMGAIPESNRFWVDDMAFIEWNGKTLKITAMEQDGCQLIIYNNGKYDYSEKDTQVYVYTPEKDAVNQSEAIITDNNCLHPARRSIYEKRKTTHTNIPISIISKNDDRIEYLTYDVVMTTSQIELFFHISTFAKGKEQKKEQIYHQIFEVVEEGFVL